MVWRFIAALAALSALGCASTGTFVWFQQLPREEVGSSTGEYIIGAGDSVSILVYQQPDLTTRTKVRSDGRIAMSLLGEVVAAGKRPATFAQELETALKQYIVSPRVTVNIEDSRAITITMLGEISKKGTLTLERPASILQAFAQSGGLTEYASEDKIFVIRQVPDFRRIRFSYKGIMNNENGASLFPLRNGDVIEVE
jgi:polysaccharide export outer membrane protein